MQRLEDEVGSKWDGTMMGQVPYDPQENLIASFSRWRGTVLPLVLTNTSFWLLMIIHVALLTFNEYVRELTPMDSSIVIGLPASLLIFLTVFYNGNCYTRFFELWEKSSEIASIVNNWILQTAFIFEELADDVPEVNKTELTGVSADDDSMWLAARRILSAMYLLFMALDSSIDSSNIDCIGRAKALPNIMNGDGVDDDEYAILIRQGLLTETEVQHLKAYPGFKAQVPIKWALNELRQVCKPEDRTQNQARNYEAMCDIAAQFNKTAVLIVTLMQQPVPFVYFHVLKSMMIVVNSLIAYELVNVFEDSWVLSIITFAVVAAMLLGLQEIAGRMADPFGTDDTDFDTHTLCADTYKNAVLYLKTKYPADVSEEKQAFNPLKSTFIYTNKFSSPSPIPSYRDL
jgi:predicted membrane chloride channel (bestrophin family)